MNYWIYATDNNGKVRQAEIRIKRISYNYAFVDGRIPFVGFTMFQIDTEVNRAMRFGGLMYVILDNPDIDCAKKILVDDIIRRVTKNKYKIFKLLEQAEAVSKS